MREKFNHLYLDSQERKLLIHSLVVCKILLLYFTEMRVLIERCEISCDKIYNLLSQGIKVHICEYYGAAEPLVRCGESHLSGLTEPLRSLV
jgi:hypothetical protein